MVEQEFKPNYPKTKFSWCRGRDIRVKIWIKNETYPREGTVTALDPRQKKGPWQHERGLFLDGAELGKEPIEAVFIYRKGKNVLPYIKQSFGAGL